MENNHIPEEELLQEPPIKWPEGVHDLQQPIRDLEEALERGWPKHERDYTPFTCYGCGKRTTYAGRDGFKEHIVPMCPKCANHICADCSMPVKIYEHIRQNGRCWSCLCKKVNGTWLDENYEPKPISEHGVTGGRSHPGPRKDCEECK